MHILIFLLLMFGFMDVSASVNVAEKCDINMRYMINTSSKAEQLPYPYPVFLEHSLSDCLYLICSNTDAE